MKKRYYTYPQDKAAEAAARRGGTADPSRAHAAKTVAKRALSERLAQAKGRVRTMSADAPGGDAASCADRSKSPGDASREPAGQHRRQAAAFRCLYESRDARLYLFEDRTGHIAAVRASRLA